MITKPYTLTAKPSLTLGWLYPELMSTYGDRGNILVLQKIAEDNNLDLKVERINQNSKPDQIIPCDLLFMGGAQDLQQEIVNQDLLTKKGEILKQKIEKGTPGLYICGAYQFMGNYYKDAYGTKIEGLGVFDMYTQSFKTKERLIGNIVIKPITLTPNSKLQTSYFIGFENHGGRTYLKNPEQAFAKVIVGYGNNGKDKSEGIFYKNSIGTYMHGPILPSNPQLAVWLLKKAYFHKFKEEIEINFENLLAEKAKIQMLKRLKTSY